MKKQRTRRHVPAAHQFELDCECYRCTCIRNEVAYRHDANRRWNKMMTPVVHHLYDARYLDDLMTKLGVRDEDRADIRQALIDTAEPGKEEPYWAMDAALVVGLRRGEIEEPPSGSPGSKYLHADEDTQAERAS